MRISDWSSACAFRALPNAVNEALEAAGPIMVQIGDGYLSDSLAIPQKIVCAMWGDEHVRQFPIGAVFGQRPCRTHVQGGATDLACFHRPQYRRAGTARVSTRGALGSRRSKK